MRNSKGRITLRRALADSRNVPAVRLLDQVGIQNVIELARKFGITSPLPPYLPLALGAADLTLIEHTSAFTVFPDDGIHIEPHYIRRVTSYDGAVLEEAAPEGHRRDSAGRGADDGGDARGRGAVRHRRARERTRAAVGREDRNDKRFHRCLVHRIHAADSRRACGWATTTSASRWAKKKRARAPRCRSGWSSCSRAMQGMPVEEFPNVVPLEKIAPTRSVQVDTPDTAPPADAAEQGLTEKAAPVLPKPAPTPKPSVPAATQAAPSSTQLKTPAGPSRR